VEKKLVFTLARGSPQSITFRALHTSPLCSPLYPSAKINFFLGHPALGSSFFPVPFDSASLRAFCGTCVFSLPLLAAFDGALSRFSSPRCSSRLQTPPHPESHRNFPPVSVSSLVFFFSGLHLIFLSRRAVFNWLANVSVAPLRTLLMIKTTFSFFSPREMTSLFLYLDLRLFCAD